MKVLVVGATGFIGKSIYSFLKRENDEVVPSSRQDIDFSSLQNDKKLVKKLKGFDVVVNAVGIIAETRTQSFEQMHTVAPIILFDACQEAGVKKVIHISALGTQEGTTAYHVSKNRADEYYVAFFTDCWRWSTSFTTHCFRRFVSHSKTCHLLKRKKHRVRLGWG